MRGRHRWRCDSEIALAASVLALGGCAKFALFHRQTRWFFVYFIEGSFTFVHSTHPFWEDTDHEKHYIDALFPRILISIFPTGTKPNRGRSEFVTTLSVGFHVNHNRRNLCRSSCPTTSRPPYVPAERRGGTCCPRSPGIAFAGWLDRCQGQY